jgi:prolipoprotein diacylglyceryl transferase
MYPGISDLLNDLFGTHFSIHFPPTFGTLVAISFLLAAWTLRKELIRKEKQGFIKGSIRTIVSGGPVSPSEIFWNFVFGLIIGSKIGFAIFNSTDFFNDPQGAILSLKGNLLAGFILGAVSAFLKYKELKKTATATPEKKTVTVMPSELVSEFTMMAALGGMIGAKLFHLLEYWDDFIQDPIGLFFSGSGLTMYGGLIVGALTVLWYARKNNIPLLHLCDAAAPGLMLAYGTGRIGCQLAGDGDWGIVNATAAPKWLSFLPDWFWSFTYPHNVVNEGVIMSDCTGKYCYELAQGVFPTPLYESIACILLFFLLWKLRKHPAQPGQLFSLYLLFNGIERFGIELIRVNSKYHLGSFAFTQAQLISSLLIITGIGGWYYFKTKAAKAL